MTDEELDRLEAAVKRGDYALLNTYGLDLIALARKAEALEKELAAYRREKDERLKLAGKLLTEAARNTAEFYKAQDSGPKY